MCSLSNTYIKYCPNNHTCENVSSSEFRTNNVTLYPIRLATLPTGTAHQGEFSIFTGGKDEIF